MSEAEGEFKKRAKSCKEVHKIYEDYYQKPQEQFERYMLPKSLVSTEDIVEAEKNKTRWKGCEKVGTWGSVNFSCDCSTC